jgi:hypothetical protein
VILASWRGDRHSSVVFGDEQRDAADLGRILYPPRGVIRKTPAGPHAVSVQYRVEVAGLRATAGTECVGLPANIETTTTVRGKECRQTARCRAGASQQPAGRNSCETGAKD